MSMDPARVLIDVDEATRRLRVSRATLYAYVSRGLIHSERQAENGRAHLYALADVERLVWRKTRARKPASAAATALSWGLPVLDTDISQISRGMLTYRDRPIGEFADTASTEQLATLLWNVPADPFPGANFDPAGVAGWERLAALLANDSPIDRAIALMSLLRREVWARHWPASPGQNEARLVQALACAATGRALDTSLPLHLAIARAWNAPDAADTIRRILVCSADHELNTSAFTARVVASTDVDCCTALVAALTAFCGYEHTGVIGRSRALLEAARRSTDLDALIDRESSGEKPLAGFYHRLYPDGDPRATMVLAHCRIAPEARRLIDAVERQTGLRPNIDIALVIVESAYGLPTGAAEAMFATGRAVGWIAHAFEQRASGIRIRPRASHATQASSLPARS
jgi:citrate synthase